MISKYWYLRTFHCTLLTPLRHPIDVALEGRSMGYKVATLETAQTERPPLTECGCAFKHVRLIPLHGKDTLGGTFRTVFQQLALKRCKREYCNKRKSTRGLQISLQLAFCSCSESLHRRRWQSMSPNLEYPRKVTLTGHNYRRAVQLDHICGRGACAMQMETRR